VTAICSILAGKSCIRVISGATNGLTLQHYRDSSIHSEDSKVDPLEISDIKNIHFYKNRHQWSLAFTHASTSSKCILFSIQCLIQRHLDDTGEWTGLEWIVSEVIDWLKVRNPPLIRKISCNPDIWEEPNSGSSTTGSADRMDGRCK
jgi:hypothetical protein